jgi:hypothetical protein
MASRLSTLTIVLMGGGDKIVLPYSKQPTTGLAPAPMAALTWVNAP